MLLVPHGCRITGFLPKRSGLSIAAALVWTMAQAACINSATPPLDIGASGGAGGSGGGSTAKGGSGGQAGGSGTVGSGGQAGASSTGGVTSAGGTTTSTGGLDSGSVTPALDSGTDTNAGAGDTITVTRPDSGVQPPPKDNLYTPPFDPSTVPTLVPLFDGKTMTGWNCNPGTWKPVDGAIVGTGKGEFCITKDDFSSFRLFVSTLATNDHQGVGFWGPQPPAGKWGNGDVLCLDVMPPNEWTWDYLTNAGIATAAGSKFIKPAKNLMTEWTQAELLLNRPTGRIRMAVNGILVLDITVANLNRPKDKGPIGLQAHGGNQKVSYKDLWVEVDPKEDRLISLKP